MRFFKKYSVIGALFLLFSSGAYAMEPVKSQYDFSTTLTKVKDSILKRNIPIFAEFDFTSAAKNAKLELAPTKTIVFGNPKVGTFLMQENPNIALELPLKILVYQDASYNVFIKTTDIKQLAKEYRIKNTKVVETISNLLAEIVKESSGKAK